MKKLNFFYESYDRKNNNNFMQNNHRQFNRCRFKIFFAQVLY